jgi:hypothetical protein
MNASIESIDGGTKSVLDEYVTRPAMCVHCRSTPGCAEVSA